MRRRDFIKIVAGSAAAWPFPVSSQQRAVPIVGFLSSGTSDAYVNYVTAFRRGLGETDYVEGRNVTIEYRWAEGQYDRMPTLIADLLGRQTAAIAVTGSTAAAQAAMAATPDCSYRIRDRRRPSQIRSRREPQPAGW